MMRIFLTVLAASLAVSPALAADGLPSFHFTGARTLRRALADAPAQAPVEGRAADVVTHGHLLAQAGRDSLFGHAETAEQAAAAGAEWGATLRAAGITPGALRFESGLWILPYTSPDGRVIRGFIADAKQFPPKDEAGLRANMALAQQALTAAGLTPLSAKVLNLEYILPTYSLLYLTAPQADQAKETQLRLLNARGDTDFSIFGSAIRVVQVPRPFMMLYTGPQAGVVHMGATDAAAAQKKLEERRAFLTGQGHSIVAERVEPYEDETVKFVVSIFFLY